MNSFSNKSLKYKPFTRPIDMIILKLNPPRTKNPEKSLTQLMIAKENRSKSIYKKPIQKEITFILHTQTQTKEYLL